MKTIQVAFVSLICGGSLWTAALAQDPAPPPPLPTNQSAVMLTNPPPPGPDRHEPGQPNLDTQPGPPPVQPSPTNGAPATVTNGPAAGSAPAALATPPGEPGSGPSDLSQFTPPPDGVVAEGEKGLRLNFRNAPLEMVLNYLSDAAGFIIVPEADVRGRVDVWSSQPLTKDEAVEVLNSVLSKNGLAALRNGRILTIINKDQAKTRDIPVRTGADPNQIPKSEEIVTQIIPVRYINATQLTRDLQPLLPLTATLTANEGGNALVLTDTQANIRRMAEIVKALDTALASVSVVRVFPLKFADAKSLATVIKDLFAPQQDQARSNDPRARFMNFLRGRGGEGGPPGFGGPGGDMGGGGFGGNARAPVPRVVAVADERSNSLIVNAPEEQMPIIEEIVHQVDTDVEDITELRVFHLKHADAQEMADLLTALFPDTTYNQNARGRFQMGGRMARFAGFFGGPGGPGGTAGADANAQSQRLLKETRVVAVADPRTRSVVVSASRDLMPQIAAMIEELDSDPAKKQKVFVYSLENTDPEAVQEILEGMFPAPTTTRGYGTLRSTRNTTRQMGSQLNRRASQVQNQGFGRSSGFGGTGFGTPSFGQGAGR